MSTQSTLALDTRLEVLYDELQERPEWKRYAAWLREAIDERKRASEASRDLGRVIHDLSVGNQAAWIEWKHGKGAEAAMHWVENSLDGPGLIPDEDEPYGKEAQAYYDANKSRPFPVCRCGRPSHIAGQGKGWCSWEHYNEDNPKSPPATGVSE